MFLPILTTLALIPFATAANVTTVEVAPSGTLVFTPSSVNVSAGDVVNFRWVGSPGNHSVTQSSFAQPCDPLSGGFDSGFVFTPANITTGFAEWNLTITNGSAPIWFFCKQGANGADHCKSGMVGAFNAPTTGNHTFAAFKAAAAAFNSTPGQAEGGLVGVGASASTIPGPFTGSITGYGNPTATAPSTTKPTSTASSTSASSGASALSVPAFMLLLGSAVVFTLA
jgi:plastocyanin